MKTLFDKDSVKPMALLLVCLIMMLVATYNLMPPNTSTRGKTLDLNVGDCYSSTRELEEFEEQRTNIYLVFIIGKNKIKYARYDFIDKVFYTASFSTEDKVWLTTEYYKKVECPVGKVRDLESK